MKRKLCMALAAMLAFGAVPVYAGQWADYSRNEIEYLFTAKMGTMDFRKNGKIQPLDVEIYSKDGYTMLPLRTFLTAIDADADMTWDDAAKRATVDLLDETFSFDVTGNRIWFGNQQLSVSGEMEVRDGRVFVPLRNWRTILNACGYEVKAEDIIWDAKTKTAAIRATDVILQDNTPPFTLQGEGKQAVYSMKPTTAYDDIQPIGNGYFIARKYVQGAGDLQGNSKEPENWKNWRWFVLDAAGKELLTYSGEKEVTSVKKQGEGLIRVSRQGESALVADKTGAVQFETAYSTLYPFSEGLAAFLAPNDEQENADGGYIDKTGKIAIPQQFYDVSDFSEGLAAVAVTSGGTSRPSVLYGYINPKGEWVIEPQYTVARAFQNGIARVSKNGKIGYIDQNGREIVKPRYDWGSDFYEGKAFVKEKDGRVFLIDTTGKHLKQITEGRQISDLGNGVFTVQVTESSVSGHVEKLTLYFNENGQISETEANLQAGLSEGLATMQEQESGKYGYADENGNWVIAPDFDRAEDFVDGYAVVVNSITLADGTEDVEWGIIQHPQMGK